MSRIKWIIACVVFAAVVAAIVIPLWLPIIERRQREAAERAAVAEAEAALELERRTRLLEIDLDAAYLEFASDNLEEIHGLRDLADRVTRTIEHSCGWLAKFETAAGNISKKHNPESNDILAFKVSEKLLHARTMATEEIIVALNSAAKKYAKDAREFPREIGDLRIRPPRIKPDTEFFGLISDWRGPYMNCDDPLDAWGRKFVIFDERVVSGGEDGVVGTDDDLK